MLISLTTLLAALRAIFRSRAALELENLALRHQIGVLQLCLVNCYGGADFTDKRVSWAESHFGTHPVAVKRSEPRSTLQPRTQTPDDFIPDLCRG
jgi:hypothetical protein